MKYLIHFTFVDKDGSYGDGNITSSGSKLMNENGIEIIKANLIEDRGYRTCVIANFMKLSKE